MKTTEDKGYSIGVTTEQKDELWAADVCVWTLDHTASPLNNKCWGADGLSSAKEAEERGLEWAKEQIDIFPIIR